jgi:hypothetical protein
VAPVGKQLEELQKAAQQGGLNRVTPLKPAGCLKRSVQHAKDGIVLFAQNVGCLAHSRGSCFGKLHPLGSRHLQTKPMT